MTPEQHQTELLDEAGKYLAGGGTGLFVLPAELNLIVARGEGSRKMLLSALYGIAVEEGLIDIDGNLDEPQWTTIPGMTKTSLLPKAAAEAGISFDELVERILLDAGLDK